MSRDEPRTVLVPEDRVDRVLNRLIVAGLILVSGLSLVGAALLAAHGDTLSAGSLAGLALVFAWTIDRRTSEPTASLSRRLSQGSLRAREPTPNKRLEQTRGHDGQANSTGAQLRR